MSRSGAKAALGRQWQVLQRLARHAPESAKADLAGLAYGHAKRTKNRRRMRYWNPVLQYWTGLCAGMTPKQARVTDPTLS